MSSTQLPFTYYEYKYYSAFEINFFLHCLRFYHLVCMWVYPNSSWFIAHVAKLIIYNGQDLEECWLLSPENCLVFHFEECYL